MYIGRYGSINCRAEIPKYVLGNLETVKSLHSLCKTSRSACLMVTLALKHKFKGSVWRKEKFLVEAKTEYSEKLARILNKVLHILTFFFTIA